MTRTLLLVGTSKGAFILEGDADRSSWSLRGPLCEGWPIHDLQWDPATGSIYAGGGSVWYGPAVFRSDDLGETWSHSSEGLTYGDDGGAPLQAQPLAGAGRAGPLHRDHGPLGRVSIQGGQLTLPDRAPMSLRPHGRLNVRSGRTPLEALP